MKIPKYVKELMSRAEYSYHLCGKNENAAEGYTIEIAKYSHYETADTLRKEIDRLKKWVERQNGGDIVVGRYTEQYWGRGYRTYVYNIERK